MKKIWIYDEVEKRRKWLYEWVSGESPDDYARRMRRCWKAMRKCDTCEHYEIKNVVYLNFGADCEDQQWCNNDNTHIKGESGIARGHYCEHYRKKRKKIYGR